MITAKERKELAEKLAKVSCGAKEKTVYRTKHGIDDGISKSDEETGKIFSMTGEAVRLILVKVDKLIEG